MSAVALLLAGCPSEPPPNPPPPPAIVAADATLPETTVGVAYSASVKASGGQGTLVHTAEGLPPGIALAQDGALTGAATVAGDFPIKLVVKDGADQSVSATYPLKVHAAPRFDTTALPGATAGSDYVATVSVSGGKAPVAVSVTSGELPGGLTFEPAALTISGVAAAEGSFPFTLEARDANGATVTQAFTVVVSPPLAITTTSLANGNVGSAYLQTLKGQGGKTPLTWELAQGMLPDGLTLDAASGRLSGTPTAGGNFALTVALKDSNGAAVTADLSFSIFANGPPSITSATLPNGVVGISYAHNLVASEGAPPYAWSVSSGALPAGLQLSSAGAITGAPTSAGPASFQVTVTDANGQTAAKALTLTVYTELVISTASLPESYTGLAYSHTLSATGGQTPYSWAVAGGALPAGITLTSSGILSGTPTTPGSYGVTLSVTDASGQTPTKPLTLTIHAPPAIATASLPDGVVGTNYSQPLLVTGGKAPHTWAVTAGTLPAGIQLIGNTITGTPSQSGTSTFVLTVTDATGKTDQKTLSIAIYQTLAITYGTLPDAYVGANYNETLTAAGGATPYQWAVIAGTPPAGLTLAANGTLSGTPTTPGTSNFTVEVTAQNGSKASKALTLIVRSQPALSLAPLADGYVGNAYSATLSGTGGRTPYTFAVTAGSLPAGLTLSTTGVVSGTPTTAATSTFSVTLSDANGVQTTEQYSIAVHAVPSITTTTLADGYIGSSYSRTVAATGGKAPLSFSVSSGNLPAGLALSAAGAITGVPTATGTALFTVQVTDANNRTATASLSIAVFAAPQIVTTSLPDGTLNVAYAASLIANGGKAPLTWAVTAGALPAGITLAPNGALSGTPTAASTSSFSVTVTDANNISATANLSIVVFASLTVSTSSPLPDGYAQVAYSISLQAAGGKSPYAWSLTAGQLPSGLNLSSTGVLSGTATGAASATFTATVTDANNQTASKPFALTVVATPTITTASLSDGYVGLPYSGAVVGQNGKPPYAFAVTVGTLPAGITLDSSTGQLSGAPTTKGSSSFEITLTDANGLTNKKTYTVGIYDAPQVTTTSPLTEAYEGSAFLATVSGSGGKTPYTWSVASGTLPAGLTLSTAGDLSGTPTLAGSYAFSLKLTDANGQTATRSFTQIVRAPVAITTASVPDGYTGTAYPATTLGASGGKAPFSWALTAGTLPTGLTLSPSGVLSGTPTVATSGATFTVTATDANAVSANRTFTVAVFAPPTITTTTVSDAYANTAYTQTLSATGGKTPRSWTVSGGSLPAGITLSTAGVLSGTTAATGSFSFDVLLTDANGVSDTQTFTLAVLPTLQITTTSLADAYVGTAYSTTVSATGGKTPYTFAITSGALPAGLNLTGATLSGTATAASAPTFTLTVTDANGRTATQSLTLAALAAPQVSTTTLADGYAGSAYSAQLAATGGKTPFSWAVSTGSLPAGVSLSAGGALSGTPTSASNSTFTVIATDANGITASKSLTIVVLQALSITTASVPDAYTGTAYTTTLAATGGKTPYTWSLPTGSTLPAGLSLAGNGTISGTATAAGAVTFTARVTDANGVGVNRTIALEVLAPPSITTNTLADGYPSTAYADTIVATGGRAPLSFAAANGLPAGVTLASNGALSGTPTTAGTSTFTVTVTDGNGVSSNKTLSIIVRATLQISTASLNDGYLGTAYTATAAATGGRTPYTWSIGTGALPAGLTLTAGTGAITGTPTAANSYSFTLRVTDANGVTADKALTLVTYQAPSITTAAALPDAYKDSAYSQTLAATGGKAPLTWAITSGAPPAGMTLSNAGVLSGTPTAVTNASFTVQLTDANGQTGTKAMTLTVLDGFFITTATLSDGYTGTAYSQTLAASGGQSPYTWSVQTGSALPAGLTLSSAGVISGTPTTAGSGSFTVRAVDANAVPTTKTLSIVVRTPPSITTASLADGYVGTAYNLTLAGSGGATPYSWSVSPALPAGLTLASTTGALSGTPTAAVPSTSYTFTLTDANNVAVTRALPLVVYALPNVTVPALADAYVGLAYSITPTVTGGKAPITWAMNGTFPAWISINATGVMSGTPTSAGPVSFDVTASDANTKTDSAPVAFTVYAQPAVATTTLPTPYISVPYQEDVTATGGKAPLTWAVTAGTLPNGVNLSTVSNAARLSGTPTTAGAFTFTLTVTDANGKAANRQYTVTVPPAVSITTASLADGYRTQSYSATLAATGGLAPYTFTVASGVLPATLALANSGALTGTLSTTANTETFVARVTDANGTTATKSLTLNVYSVPSITTVSYADGYVGQPYNATTVATGGKPALTWSVTAGALPAGVTLNASTGALTGTPTTAGPASFTLTVTDVNGRSANKPMSLTVFAPPAVTAATLSDAYAGDPYSRTLAVTGGKTPFTWTVTQGALPPGLTLGASTGTIGTTVASTGITNGTAYNFTATVTDANNQTASRPFTITAWKHAAIGNASLAIATEGVTWFKSVGVKEQITVTDGKAPFTFAAVGLPAGLSVNTTTGELTGIPDQGTAGTHSVTLRATDSNSDLATRTVSLTVETAKAIAGGGTRSLPPSGSAITDQVTIFVLGADDVPRAGVGVRVRKNGTEYATPKQALTDANGKVWLSGLGLNGTTDTLDITANGKTISNVTLGKVNASVVTLPAEDYPLPGRRSGAVAAYNSVSGKVMLFGGTSPGATASLYGGQCANNTLRLQDAATGDWVEQIGLGLTGGPAGRSNAVMAVVNNTAYMVGGESCGGGAGGAETWGYSFSSNAWTMYPQHPSFGASGMAISAINNARLMTLGGSMGQGGTGPVTSDVAIYDTVTMSWLPQGSQPGMFFPGPARARAAGAFRTAMNKGWFCGGRDDAFLAMSDCWSYMDTGFGNWQPEASLPAARYGHAMAYDPATDSLYVFGGLDSAGAYQNTLFKSAGLGWAQVSTMTTPPARTGHVLVWDAAGSRLVLFGGSNASGPLDDLWTFDGTTWTQRTAATPNPTTHTLSGAISGGKIPGPGESSMVEVAVTTSKGRRLNATAYLSATGTGSYTVAGIPTGETITLSAVNSGSAPGNPQGAQSFWSIADLGTLGPITTNTTQNIALPAGPMTSTSVNGTLAVPADWTSAPGVTLMTSRTGYPLFALRNGDATVTGTSFTGGYLPAGTGTQQDLIAYGSELTAAICETSHRPLYGISSGALGNIVIPTGARARAPGLPECTSFGNGYAQAGMAPSMSGSLQRVATGDVDGDGFSDLLVTSLNGSIELFKTMPGGGLTQMGTIPAGPQLRGITTLDFNKDGMLDFAVTSNGPTTVYFGAGNGTFTPGPNYFGPGGSGGYDVAAGDLNSDGNPDLVVTYNTLIPELRVLFGNGSNSLTPSNGYPLTNPRGLVLADMNGDTHLDVVVATGNDARILPGSATGALGGSIVLPSSAGGQPYMVAVGDFDGNGLKDVATSRTGSNQLQLNHQTLAGVYNSGLINGVASSGDIEAADMDGDGDVDLVVASTIQPEARVLANTSGTWTTQVTLVTNGGPAVNGLVAVDLNKDGLRDVGLISDSAASTFIQMRPVPTASDATFSFTAPTGAALVNLRRGPYATAVDWVYWGPATATNSISMPLASTLAPSRTSPVGQKAQWLPTVYFNPSTGTLNPNDVTFRLMRYGAAAQSGGMVYVRQ